MLLSHRGLSAQVETDSTSTTAKPTTATPQQSTIHHEAHVEPQAAPTVTPTGTPSTASPPSPATPVSTSEPSPSVAGAQPSVPASSSTSKDSKDSKEHQHAKSHLAGKPPKLTPEQKQKAYEEEKKSYEEKRKRIETLAAKLRDRVRGFVEATNPGEKDDAETKRWAERIREESHDLALESFGVGESSSLPLAFVKMIEADERDDVREQSCVI